MLLTKSTIIVSLSDIQGVKAKTEADYETHCDTIIQIVEDALDEAKAELKRLGYIVELDI